MFIISLKMTKLFFRQKNIYLILGVILFTHLFILSKLIFFPYPELFIYPYLTNQGLKPYAQILDQHFPGLMFLPVNFDNLGLNTIDSARIWSISIVIIIHIMLFIVSNEIFKSRHKAIFVNILYLIWQPFFEGWILWIDSFLPILLLPAFYLFYKRHFFLTGLLLGTAIIFKQTIIPLSCFVWLYIFWMTRNLKTSFKFLIGVFIPFGLIALYFISIGVFRDFWFWTVTFNLTTYAKSGRGAVPSLAHFTRVLLVFGVAFLVSKKINLKEVQILLIFLIGALLGLTTRFDFVHFQPALPFAMLATVYVLVNLKEVWRLRFIGAYGLVMFWWLIIFYKGHLGNRIISFDPDTINLAAKIRNYTNDKEKIFIFGGAPHLYQMSKTLPAGDIFVFQFPWFLQVAQDRVLDGIKEDEPEIIVSDRSIEIEGVKITDFAKNIDQYINQNYQKIDSVGTADILRKRS